MKNETLEDIAIRNGATDVCETCKKHLVFPTTFCSGCGMYIKNCLCLEYEKESISKL